jgi:hypothetical protein
VTEGHAALISTVCPALPEAESALPRAGMAALQTTYARVRTAAFATIAALPSRVRQWAAPSRGLGMMISSATCPATASGLPLAGARAPGCAGVWEAG